MFSGDERWTRSGKDVECVCTNQTSAVLYISFIFVCVCQDPKLREVLGFGKGDNVEGKLVTVVHGNDLVNTSFLNFQAMQEDTAKVTTSPPSNHLLAFITCRRCSLPPSFLPPYLSLLASFCPQAICSLYDVDKGSVVYRNCFL